MTQNIILLIGIILISTIYGTFLYKGFRDSIKKTVDLKLSYDKYFEPLPTNDKLHCSVDDEDSDFISYNTRKIIGWIIQFHHYKMIGEFKAYYYEMLIPQKEWSKICDDIIPQYILRHKDSPPIKKITLIPIFKEESTKSLLNETI